MLKGVFLLNDAGETVVSLENETSGGDTSMISGLVGAIQMFVHKMSSEELKSIVLEDMIMHMRRVGSNHVVTLHDSNDALAEMQCHRIVKVMGENAVIGNTEGFVKLVSTMLASKNE